MNVKISPLLVSEVNASTPDGFYYSADPAGSTTLFVVKLGVVTNIWMMWPTFLDDLAAFKVSDFQTNEASEPGRFAEVMASEPMASEPMVSESFALRALAVAVGKVKEVEL